MKRVLTPELPRPGHDVQVPDAEAHHLTQVLRMRDGDRAEALDGKGHAAQVRLQIRGKAVTLCYEGGAQKGEADVLPIVLEVAILKGEAMEWVVEKAVELGVRTLVPLTTAHTVVQVDRKGPEAFRDRWQRIADQALKQCGRLHAMEVALPIPLEQHLSQASDAARWVADESVAGSAPYLPLALQSEEALPEVRILVGPEGGWSETERSLLVASRCRFVSLGPLILRAETAALFSASCAAARLRSG